MRSAPITSGKALSVRPWQMRGVLRLGRSADPWPTWWLHRRRIHVRALRVHPALRNLAVSVAAVGPPGWCASPAVSHRPRKRQRPPVAGPWMPPCGSLAPRTTTLRMTRRPSSGRGSSRAHGAASTRSSPVRVHPRSTGLHVTGRRPPVPTGAQPGLRQLQPSPRPRQSRPCRLPSSEPLGGVARRSDTNEKVTADFQRLGTCHRKGESAVGVSTDSATPTI
jgi:hypothetical protein